MKEEHWRNLELVGAATVIVLAVFGIFLRIYHITENKFFFYDEGYYLNFHRPLVELIERHAAVSAADFGKMFAAYCRGTLASAKALWFFLINLRVFFLNVDSWFFPRVISAVSGILTLGLVFLFSRRYFTCRAARWLSLALLALLPGHVFYSRLAMQEALSTLLFLAGFYLYLFPRKFGARTFFSALCLAGAFFTNYRLIILPVLVAFSELWSAYSQGGKPGFRKYLWHTLTFFSFIFLIGNLDGARNTTITFGWMFHQSHLAAQQFSWFNFFSFPYYLFKLESPLFAALFFANAYFVFKRQWSKLLPFLLVLLQMLIFSFASEKGARYLCVVMPFMAMAVAGLIAELWNENKATAARYVMTGVVAVLLGTFAFQGIAIARFQTDYDSGVFYLKKQDPRARIVATQKWVLNLYTASSKDVVEAPNDFASLVTMYRNGFRYLIVDPQVYVSWTQSGTRFDLPLTGYFNFILQNVPPVKIFPHMNRSMLERFVFDHNQNLRASLEFLSSGNKAPGALRVYDIGQCIEIVNQRLQERIEQ